MKKLLLILMMVSFPGLNTAQTNYLSMGAGSISCGKMISQTSDAVISDAVMADAVKAYTFFVKSWMEGFITALNHSSNSQKGINTDADAIWYAVMNQCREKPLTNFPEAVLFVYNNELTE